MEKLMKISGLYGLIAGIAIPVVWFFILSLGITGNVLSVLSLEYCFLLGAELLTAVLLAVSGIGLLRQNPLSMPLFYIAMGMLLYAVIFGAGKFFSLGIFAPAGFFSVIVLGTGILLILNLRNNR